MEKSLKKILGQLFYENTIRDKLICLGSIVERESNVRDKSIKKSRKKLVTVFKITKLYIRIKNVKNLLKAIRKLNSRGEKVSLDIIGGGDAVERVEKMIQK